MSASLPLPAFDAPGAHDHAPTAPPRRPRRCTVGCRHYATRDRYRGDDEVAYLRLSGRWLEALGFTIGTRLRITAEAGVLTVTVDGAET
ncbi:SymE family type I addiction module toxin [Luteimonas sp. FCS-9]|uniref:SymE family type I addiction module toxin n=1 Tax=Luteimonas sp. FCS-9 TaxID=1547516 RepID=UPI001E2E2EC6|nr:SymE family type I addiction module toxin [Luteimonas sp. FCS-9]